MAESLSYTLFQEPWWLDAVAPGTWEEVCVKREGNVIARLPYMVKRRMGITVLTMPVLTPRLGPWFAESTGKVFTRQTEQKQLMSDLIRQLPKFDAFRQCFSHEIINWLPFYWQGYQSSLQYTYRLEDISDPTTVWKGFRDSLRNTIKKAQKSYEVCEIGDIHELFRLVKATFVRKQTKTDITEQLVERVHAACALRGSGRAFFGIDRHKCVHGAAYFVSDDRCMYYIMAGTTEQGRRDGISGLILWEAIRRAIEMKKAFDFEGSMIEPVERFFRTFGAIQVPLVFVHKESARFRALSGVWKLGRRFSSIHEIRDPHTD